MQCPSSVTMLPPRQPQEVTTRRSQRPPLSAWVLRSLLSRSFCLRFPQSPPPTFKVSPSCPWSNLHSFLYDLPIYHISLTPSLSLPNFLACSGLLSPSLQLSSPAALCLFQGSPSASPTGGTLFLFPRCTPS